MGQGASLLDLLISLLQSLVVLLLASGVYIALVVRKPGGSPLQAEPGATAPSQGPQTLRASSADSQGS